VAAPLEAIFAGQDRGAMVDLACDLVNIPSPTGDEGAIGDYVARRFAELGLTVSRQEVEPGRNNILARLPGTGGGPTLLFLAHFDTSTNPGEDLPIGYQAQATLEDGWIYGLGISNMKCAFAGFWSALQMLAASGTRLAGDVVVAGVVGEIEKAPVDLWQGRSYRGGGIGARYLVNHGLSADFCINGEPTGLRLQTGNAGYAFAKLAVRGMPQATYAKDQAIDPLPKAFRLHQALADWEPTYQARHPHPKMKPLIGVGGIYGGYPYKPSITPAFCNLYLHLNLVPGQSIRELQTELEALLATEQAADPELEASVELYLVSNGHQLPPDHRLATAVAEAHGAVFGSPVGEPNPERYSVSSDNSPLAEFGIPGITYGAGGINLAGEYSMYQPGIGEVVRIDNLAACARVYAAAALALCGAAQDA
jgi:acetylornithine deacetylase